MRTVLKSLLNSKSLLQSHFQVVPSPTAVGTGRTPRASKDEALLRMAQQVGFRRDRLSLPVT